MAKKAKNDATTNMVEVEALNMSLKKTDRKVLRLIPGLEHAEFVRFGTVHRNTYINAPRVLSDLGFDASAYQPTERFQELFSKDATCVDDPGGEVNIYAACTLPDAIYVIRGTSHPCRESP